MNVDTERLDGLLVDFQKRGDVEEETIEKYQKYVSDEVLYIWKNYGYGSFCNGFFRLINPDEYMDSFQRSFDMLDRYIPVMTTGMGDIIVQLYYSKGLEVYMPRYHGHKTIIGGFLDTGFGLDYFFRLGIYKDAVKKYGVPDDQTCFAYTIPISRGGYEDVEHMKTESMEKYLDEMYQIQGQFIYLENKIYATVSKKAKDFTYEIHPDTLNITQESIFINQKEFKAPLNLDEIMEYVNEHNIKGFEDGRTYKEQENSLTVYFCMGENIQYNGTLLIDGKPWVYAKRKMGEFGDSQEQRLEKYMVHYSLCGGNVLRYISITPFDAARYNALVEKYKIKETDEEILEFKDFNFKLMVIQNLMYEQKILKPEFQLEEFAEQSKRDIDTFSDEPISAVVQYFKKLPIPKSMAEHVTELNQDGGDEIYMQISPQWDGEEDWYMVKKGIDAGQFPNLKKVEDLFLSKKAKKDFEALGIEIRI